MIKLDQLINELCPNGVEYKRIDEIAINKFWLMPATPKFTIDGEIPYITSKNIGNCKIDFDNVKFITMEDYLSISSNRPILVDDILISMIGTLGEVARVEKEYLPFYGQNMYLVRLNTDIINLGYFLHYFNSSKVKDKLIATKNMSSQGYLKANHIDSLIIPLPPLPIQHEIVRILDNFAELTAELIAKLKTELTARKKQYECYRDQLLTFGDDVPKVALGDIATDMYRGAGIKRDEVTEDGTPCVRYGEIYTTYNIWFDTCVSYTHSGTKTFGHGDVLFAITGESVEDIAKSCAYIGYNTCFAGGDIVVMKHNQNPKYVAYALSTSDAQVQKSKGKVKSKVVHSSVPSLKDIRIPLPSLEEQARIVAILDNLNALTTDIANSLPTEIEARRKQYEYYRDQLLTFKEVGA